MGSSEYVLFLVVLSGLGSGLGSLKYLTTVRIFCCMHVFQTGAAN